MNRLGMVAQVTRRRRVLFYIPFLHSGGAERQCVTLASYLAKNDFEVALATSGQRNGDFFVLDDSINRIALPAYAPNRGLPYRLTSFLTTTISLRRAIQRYEPDVCIAFTEAASAVLAISIIGYATPTICSERNNPLRYRNDILTNLVRFVGYSRATVTVCQTAAVTEYIANRFKARTTVIPNAIDLDLGTSVQSNARQPVVLCVGRLTEQKGVERLMRIFARLDPQLRARWTLRIVGTGPQRSKLEALASAHNIGDRVVFRDATRQIVQHYREASILCMTSRYEGFPNSLLEGMSFGLPCVTYDVPFGPSELVANGENGFLIPDGDEASFLVALEKLIRSEALRDRMGNRAMEFAKTYRLGVVGKAWADLVREVMAR